MPLQTERHEWISSIGANGGCETGKTPDSGVSTSPGGPAPSSALSKAVAPRAEP